MPYRNSLKLLFIFLLPLQLFAQEKDVTGLWRGFMYNDTTQQNYRYEIAISQNSKGKLFGYSHTYFILGDKEYHGVKKLKVKRDGDEIITEDDELIVNNYPIPPAKGVHQLNTLILKIKDTVMILSGAYETNRTRDFRPLTGYVHVERKTDYSQSALVPHLQELGLAKNLNFLTDENNTATEQPVVMLKPMASDDEEKLIVINAKKQQTQNSIKSTNTPVVKTPPVPPIEAPKPEAVAITKPTSKIVEEVVTKTPAPAKAEMVTTSKPAAVVAPSVATKPVVTAVVKAPPVKITEPIVTKPASVIVQAPATKPVETAAIKAPTVKVAEPVIAKSVPVKKPDPVDPTAATDLNKRKIENIQALYFKSDSLQLTLYDNGEVDGDTVSVVMNGVVIMPKVGLTTNAVKKTIYTQDAGDSIQLIMYAETLGSLPPNTGLLIVYDGNDRYEIRFSGDMQKSSAIVFRRRKN